jgi:hypothetical protein
MDTCVPVEFDFFNPFLFADSDHTDEPSRNARQADLDLSSIPDLDIFGLDREYFDLTDLERDPEIPTNPLESTASVDQYRCAVTAGNMGNARDTGNSRGHDFGPEFCSSPCRSGDNLGPPPLPSAEPTLPLSVYPIPRQLSFSSYPPTPPRSPHHPNRETPFGVPFQHHFNHLPVEGQNRINQAIRIELDLYSETQRAAASQHAVGQCDGEPDRPKRPANAFILWSCEVCLWRVLGVHILHVRGPSFPPPLPPAPQLARRRVCRTSVASAHPSNAFAVIPSLPSL